MSGEVEDIGFDETEDLQDDDLVVLQGPDGAPQEFVVLAVIDREEGSYALLARREPADDDGDDVLVARYQEDETGAALFEPLEDDAVLASLRDAVAHLVELEVEA